MTAGIKYLFVRQRPVRQPHKHLFKLGAINLSRMVFKDTHDPIMHKMKSQCMKIANIAEQAITLTSNKLVF